MKIIINSRMKQRGFKIQKVVSLSLLFWLTLTFSFSQSKNSGSVTSLPRSTPEAEGISSKGIIKFLDAVESGKNEIHSFVIVRHGKIVSEGWWNPYGKDLRHVMFSVSKSFTSTGVGIAIAEGKLKLTDKVVSFFPQSLPDTVSNYMKEMTVRDLLMMSAGMETDPIGKARNSKDWPNAFLSSKIEHKPGTVFKYNNMATFMLSAIVQKATGEKLFDYLKPRLLEPLGIRNVTWDETPEGYTFGAIGMRIQSEDMAKFGLLLLQKGKWNGKQLVPESWIAEATSFKIESNDPGNKNPKELNDWAQGYCYQFWRCRNNAYRADGLGGQFIIVMPEKDAVVVLTASASNTQEELNLVWDHLLPAMSDKALPEDPQSSKELAKRIAALSVSKRPSSINLPPISSRLSGKRIELAKNELGIQALTILLKNSEAQIRIIRDNDTQEITSGLNTWKSGESKLNTLVAPPRSTQVLPIKFASVYSWTDDKTLELTTKFVEESIGTESWLIHFEESGTALNAVIEIKGMRPGPPGAPPLKLEGKVIN